MLFFNWFKRVKAGPRNDSRGTSRRGKRKPSTVKLQLEALEDRYLPSTITVVNTNDTGTGSFRQAILDSNASVGVKDTIAFNIPGSGVHTISTTSALPTITDSVIIDGYTQPGASKNTNGAGLADNAVLQIELNGTNASPVSFTDGLTINAANSTVRGLAINRFAGANGISIGVSGTGSVIEGNFIGTNAAGTAGLGNGAAGVYSIATNVTIGGTTAAARNIVSGNVFRGISIWTGANNNLVEGNFVGTNAAGTAALANKGDAGIMVSSASNVTIGGTDPLTRNLISGNQTIGLRIGGTGALAQGNFIGTDVTGTLAVPNGSEGIEVYTQSTIGGTAAGAGNLISGNKNNGIHLLGTSFDQVLIQGNLIGTDVTGTLALGNQGAGVGTSPANGNPPINPTIGGTTPAARNIISANLGGGIRVSYTPNPIIQGNFIGLDITGTQPLGNQNDGVSLFGTSGGTIGGTAAGAGNVIASNTGAGIVLTGTSNVQVQIQGNLIGTDATGMIARGNTLNGIYLDGVGTIAAIGGSVAGARNVISANGQNGIYLFEGLSQPNDVIQGNFIGTNILGAAALGNANHGILINSTNNTTIGGSTASAGNVISGNGIGNLPIHLNDGSTLGPAGIFLDGITNFGVTGTLIESNHIGTAADGVSPLGNNGSGIVLYGGNSSNTTQLNTIQANTIAFNTFSAAALAAYRGGGVVIQGGSGVATRNLITANSIYQNKGLGIDLGNDGVTPNHVGVATGPNNLQNYPVITGALSSGGVTTITGTLNSTANTAFTLEFFANAAPDPTGFGEGQTYLGSKSVTTDGSGNVSFTATVPTAVASGQSITATATDPNNNTSEFSGDDPVNAADLALTMTGLPGTVHAGNQVTFTLTVTNNGPAAASSVTVTNPLPGNATFVSASGSYTLVGGTVTWNLGTLAAGANASVNLVVSAVALGSITNTASVTSSMPDPNLANNSATAIVQVIPDCVPAPANLVDWWPAEGNTTDIQGGNSGTLQNGATYAAGEVGQAFSFNGVNASVQVGSRNLGTAFSVEFWMFPTSSGGYQHLVSNAYTSSANYGALYLNGTYLNYWQGGSSRAATPGSSIPQNAWSHVALTYDGSVDRLYINGVLKATSSAHSETFNNALKFGYAITASDSYFKGQLDEISLYNRTLTATDLLGIYQAGAAGKCITTSATIAAPSVTYNGNGTVTVTLTSIAGTPTGNESLSVDGGAALTQPLVNGVATFILTSPNGGDHSLLASYADQNNFGASSATGTFHVNPAPLTVTANDTSKVYGSANPNFTAYYSGFVLGQGPGDLMGALTFSTPATSASHVGSYTITPSGLSSTNYSITYVAGFLTVTPTALIISADNKTKLYGAALPTLTASYSGFVNGDTAASLTTQPTLTTTATAASHVSGDPYSISVSAAVDTDYTISYVAGSLTVTPASLTVTAANQTKLYGAQLPILTAGYSGFVNGDTSASLTTQPSLSTTATAASHVGSYTISVSGAVDSDYTISYVAGVLSVTPVALTISADNQTKAYGAAVPALTASYAGFVNGDNSANLTTQPTLSSTATASSHVGSYIISASGAVDSDYTIGYVAGVLSVTPVALTISADNQTKAYGAALPALTASYAGFVNGDNSASLTTQPSLSTTATAASHVGTYASSVSGAVDSDYTIGYVAGVLSVTPVALTISADNQTKAYGAALPTLTASYAGFVNGDNSVSLTTQPSLSTTATAASHVGSYTISVSGAVDSDYTIGYVAGVLSVTPVALIISADNQTKVYGAALPALTASYAGFVNGDNSASLTTQPSLSSTATAASHVGTYAISASGAVDSDYTIGYVAGVLSVTPVALTICADNQTKAYGAALPALTASYAGFVNGDNSVSLTTQPSLSTTATATSHVGSYTISVNGAVDSDYTIGYVAGVLSVTPVALIISADNQTKAYGAALPALTASYTGFVNGDNSANLTTQPTLSTTATAASHVGSYTISASGAVDSDYTISYVAGALSVTSVALTISADNQTKLYGAPLPALTASYSGFVNGDTSVSLMMQATITTTATASSHVSGSPYSISASGAADSDYTISYVAGVLSVTPVALTISADNQTKAYGAALPTLTASYAGFVNGDTSASLPTPPTIMTTATAASHVGSYPISASGAVDSDYTISYVAGALSVTPVALSISADNQTKAYGAALPTLTASYNGFVNGDTSASLTPPPTITTTATAASHVGSYPISASGAQDSDYTISYVAGALSVTPVALTISADNQTKAYGAALPTLTASYAGFVNGDTSASLTPPPTITTTATAASHVGSYPISASGAADSDYTISYVAGALSVTPVALTISADNQTKAYGAALPTLTASYAGFVNGDISASLGTPPTLTTTATAASHEGSYPISANGAADSDYTISYVAGILSVTPVGLSVVADNQTKAYGAALPPLTASYSGFVNGDTSASLGTPPTITTTAMAASHVGSYPISASGAADSDYTISYVAGALSVTPVALTISADNQTKAYGAALPTLTASYAGFVNGDTSASLTPPPPITTTATATSHVGSYPISASGAQDSDYTISYVAGALSVTPVALTITADSKTKAYGAALPTLTASYSGFVNGDTSASLLTPPTITTTATAASHVGGYPISASDAVDNDYIISYVAGALRVTPVILTISADNQTKLYGAALPTLSASYSGFVNGDTSASLTTLPTLSTTATASSHVLGSPYSISASSAAESDYAISYVAGALSVTPLALTISADNQTEAYGAALPTLTASYSGFVNGDTSASLTPQPTITTTATAASHVGSYPISASGAADSDYTISYVAGILSVTPVGLSVVADNQTKAYGAALPPLTASYSGFVNGDTSASLTPQPTITTTATAASHVGSYPISASGAADSDYTISYVAGALSVTPVGLSIVADNQTKAYGAALPPLTASYSGFVNGDTGASLTPQPTITTTATAASHVGSYPISASGAADSDYTISYVAGTLSVTPVALSIVADNQTKAYGAALPPLTASYSGFVNGDTSASLATPPTITTTATAASHVRSYPISASAAADSDYTISYVAGALSVTPVGLSIVADNQTKAYGAALPPLTASYSGFVNGDTSASLGTPPTITTTATAASHVGSYPISASGAADSDYTISYVAGALNVTPVALTISADNQTKAYGAALPPLTASYSGFVNGDTSASLVPPPTITTTATAASHVGGYPISASAAVDSDYSISYVAGALSVTPVALTISADNQTKLYGAPLPTLTASYSGFVNGDTSASLATQPTIMTTATAASHVGSYPISASGAADSDYTISYVAGILSVTAVALTISADNQTKAYGAALPPLTASYSGFVNGDTSASLGTPPTLTTTATASSHVSGSPYSISASGAADSDYTISYVAGALSVTPVGLSVVANNQTKAYGAALPPLTASYSGFVNGDTSASLTAPPTITTTATAASHVGSYPISASGAADSDYSISYVAGALSVTPVGLSVVADNQTKAYGAALPPLTASYSGFVNGDTSASLTAPPTITATATAASHVGSYPISASGAVDSDYSISYVAGALSVTPVALTISADNQTKAYGAALPTLTASYAGFVNGDTSASLSPPPTITTTATAASHVGSYPISASGAADSDYTISYVAGILSVTPVALTISADNQTKAYGAALPPLTASYSGFVNGDTSASLSPPPTITTTATAASHVGSYPISASAAADSDYTISYVAGALSVTRVGLSIVADNQTKAYGAALPPLTASYSGFVNGDTSASLTPPPTITTTATAASHVGSYPISASGAADSDYTISYVAGALNVTPVALTITANNQTKAYGAPLPTLTASYSGFVNGDTSASLTTAPTLSTTTTANSHVGSYAIPVSGAVDADYSISYGTGTLTVTPAGLTITANSISKTYGQSISFSGSEFSTGQVVTGPNTDGLLNGDTVTSVTLASAGAAATATVAGSPYAIAASAAVGTGLGNYTIHYVNGSLTVNPAATSISGHVYSDLTGNGLTSDDPPAQGVLVQLFRDCDGQFDSKAQYIATATTGSDGSYSFANLAPARYYVQEVLPANTVQTAPATTTFYTETVTNTSITNADFDNFSKCNTSAITGIWYLINGANQVSDLRGHVHQGDQVEAHFNVAGSLPVTVSLISYTAPDPVFNSSDAFRQKVFDLASGTFAPGGHQLVVTVPDCYFQVDFVCGAAINRLGPAGSNVFYTAQGRLLSADNGGTQAPLDASAIAAGFVYVDSNASGLHDANEAGLGGVTVTLTGTDNQGKAVNLTTTTRADGSYTFSNLSSGIYTLQARASGHTDLKNSLNGFILSGIHNWITLNAQALPQVVNFDFGESGCATTGAADLSALDILFATDPAFQPRNGQ